MAKHRSLSDVRIKAPTVPENLEKVIKTREKGKRAQPSKDGGPRVKANVQMQADQVEKLDFLKFRLKRTKMDLVDEALELLFKKHADALKDIPKAS